VDDRPIVRIRYDGYQLAGAVDRRPFNRARVTASGLSRPGIVVDDENSRSASESAPAGRPALSSREELV
jgi:hypothetical protein